MMKWKTIAVTGLILSCGYAMSYAPDAQAQEGTSSWADVGILGGLDFASRGVGTHGTYGLNGHVRLIPELNVGVYFQYFSDNISIPGGLEYTNRYFTLAGEVNYLFSGTLEGLHAGGKVGPVFRSTSLSDIDTNTDLGFGPAVGYDYAIGSGFSIGGEANVLFVTSDPSLVFTNVLANLKYNWG